jgi:predicted porin
MTSNFKSTTPPGSLVQKVLALLIFAGGIPVPGLVAAQISKTTAGVDDSSLTLYGITLYGAIDVGLQYDTHAAPLSPYLAAGVAEVVQKNSNKSLFSAVPNNMGLSRVGLKGEEPIAYDWSGVFELTTAFSPLSGELTDCLKSEAVNNGRPLSAQTSGVICPVAGEAFGRAAYAGIKSVNLGSLTFGRQRTLLADGIAQYDPAPSFAFSLIGFSAIPGGGGSQEDFYLDSVMKYAAKYGPIHVGALYGFGSGQDSQNTAVQLQFGWESEHVSIDAYYSLKKDAIVTASLSAVQVGSLPAGYTIGNSLAATVSDNTAFAVAGTYSWGPAKIFAGYEHIEFANPSHPLQPGYTDIGGYVLAFVNNTAYGNHKDFQVFWSGIRYSLTSRLDLATAYYGFRQNSYATGAIAGCTTTKSPECSGALDALSLSADWQISKRFDFYSGTMWSSATDGLASGYLSKSNVASTLGLRFRF